MWGLSLVAASGGHSSSWCVGLSLSRPLLLRSTGSRCAGSVVVAHGPSCSAACGIFLDQGSNPCPLHWQADSQPLRHQGSPRVFLISVIVLFITVCLLFSSSRSLLNVSCIFSILFLRFWIIFTIITLNSFSGSLPISSSFPIWIPFISFSCLFAMARTFNTMLNESGKSGHPCLIPDLRGNAFSFSLLSIMLAVGLSYMALLGYGMVPLYPLCGEFLS